MELGLSHCSRLPGTVDNQTDRGNTRTDELVMMICLECYGQKVVAQERKSDLNRSRKKPLQTGKMTRKFDPQI
jgi:hypothetical protein